MALANDARAEKAAGIAENGQIPPSDSKKSPKTLQIRVKLLEIVMNLIIFRQSSCKFL